MPIRKVQILLKKKKSDITEPGEIKEKVTSQTRTVVTREVQPKSDQIQKSPERTGEAPGKIPEKESRSISIKDIISEENAQYNQSESSENQVNKASIQTLDEFTSEKFMESWQIFTNEVSGDSPRVASMFKSIKPEVHPDNTISLHLSNTDQKDIFIQNYKPRLFNFLEKRFKTEGISIEAIVDTSETNGILYSDEQKYNHLISKYPEIKEIRKSFNLDFE